MDRGRRAAAGAFPMADLRGGLLLYLPLPPVKGASPVAFPDIQRSSCAVGHMRLYGAGLSWWLADVKESQKYMFTSSIGNINTYTAYLAIGLSISGAYAVYRGRQGKWGGQEGGSPAGCVLPLFNSLGHRAFRQCRGRRCRILPGCACRDTRHQAARYLALLAVFLFALPVSAFLHAHTGNPYMEAPDGILMKAGIQGGLLFLPLSAAVLSAAAPCPGRRSHCPGYGRHGWLSLPYLVYSLPRRSWMPASLQAAGGMGQQGHTWNLTTAGGRTAACAGGWRMSLIKGSHCARNCSVPDRNRSGSS